MMTVIPADCEADMRDDQNTRRVGTPILKVISILTMIHERRLSHDRLKLITSAMPPKKTVVSFHFTHARWNRERFSSRERGMRSR